MSVCKTKKNLSSLRILICNDDGIQSQGIKTLERVAKTISPDVWVVAPEYEQSGRGNALTLSESLRIREVSPRRFSITGTPADCVILAINHILAEKKPDLILSGINHGSNISEVAFISGTIGAANTGSSHLIKSIAISQECERGGVPKLATPEYFLPGIIKKLMGFNWPERVFMNINFPDALPGNVNNKVEVLPQGFIGLDWDVMERPDPNGSPYFWLSGNWRMNNHENSKTKTDASIVTDTSLISITPMLATFTAENCIDDLRKHFSNSPVA